MDSLAATRRTVGAAQGRARPDLYNIQQQLVQLQELTGQSQQRLSELRTQLEARGAQIETGAGRPGDTAHRRSSPAPAAPPRPIRCTRRPSRSSGGAALATARLGLREMLRHLSHQRAGAGRAVFHRAELRRGESGFGRGLLHPGGGEISPRRLARPRRCTTSGSWPSGGRTPPRRAMPTSAWSSRIPSPTKPRSPVTD